MVRLSELPRPPVIAHQMRRGGRVTDDALACAVPLDAVSRAIRDVAEQRGRGRAMPGLDVGDRRLPRADALDEVLHVVEVMLVRVLDPEGFRAIDRRLAGLP